MLYIADLIFPFPRNVDYKGRPSGTNAIDFILPSGTPILAAKSGIVYLTKHDSDAYIKDMAEMEKISETELMEFSERCTNFVCIDHEDGTFAQYLHLDQQAVVQVGQKVEESEIIGYCGISGFTKEPQLHLSAFMFLENGKTTSIPMKFRKPNHEKQTTETEPKILLLNLFPRSEMYAVRGNSLRR